MSNIREVHSKPRLHVSVKLLFELWPPSYTTPSPRRRRGRAYPPTSNTASHGNHEKTHWWVSFSFPYEYGAGASLKRCPSKLWNSVSWQLVPGSIVSCTQFLNHSKSIWQEIPIQTAGTFSFALWSSSSNQLWVKTAFHGKKKLLSFHTWLGKSG